jgi:hypothetical protein
VQDTLDMLDPNDVAKLKTNCEDVLANPSGYSQSAVAICMVVAGR